MHDEIRLPSVKYPPSFGARRPRPATRGPVKKQCRISRLRSDNLVIIPGALGSVITSTVLAGAANLAVQTVAMTTLQNLSSPPPSQ